MLSQSVHETERIACELACRLPPDTVVVALTGGMGAGKTAFIRGLAAGLGFRGTVSSPTFAIVNEYTPRLFHFDWYRLSGADELYELGWDEYMERGLCMVEWSEVAPSALPRQTVYVALSPVPEHPDSRDISIRREW